MKKDVRFNNLIKLEGYVYNIGEKFNQLSERVTGETSKNPGTKYIAGDLNVAVDETGLNVVTIHYTYVTEKTAKGGQNPTYIALKRIIDNPEKQWINGGKDNAFKVSCTGASIAVNDFIGGDGQKVAALRNEGGFCSIINELSPEPVHDFIVDILITKVNHVDADPEKYIAEDFATVNGCIFGYGKTIPVLIPVSFIIRNPKGMIYFEGLDATPAKPVFTKVWGKLNCLTMKIEKKEESAFGEAAVQTYTRKSKEYTITGTAKVPYDFGDEEILTATDVNTMSQNRQIMLAEIEKRYNEAKTAKTTSAVNNFNATVPEGGFVF